MEAGWVLWVWGFGFKVYLSPERPTFFKELHIEIHNNQEP